MQYAHNFFLLIQQAKLIFVAEKPGICEVKFGGQEQLLTMHRLDAQLQELDETLSNGGKGVHLRRHQGSREALGYVKLRKGQGLHQRDAGVAQRSRLLLLVLAHPSQAEAGHHPDGCCSHCWFLFA